MRRRVTATDFDWWEAFDKLEPDPWDRIREVLKLGFAAIVAAWTSAEVDPDSFDPQAKREKEQQFVSADAAMGMVKGAYGAKQ